MNTTSPRTAVSSPVVPNYFATATSASGLQEALSSNGSQTTLNPAVALATYPSSIAFGVIPSTRSSETELATDPSSTQSNTAQLSALNTRAAQVEPQMPPTKTKSLSGGVSNSTTFEKGAMLLAPTETQVLQTEYGSIGVAKDSLVLAIAFEHGIALYNLHDTKRGAVSFTFGNQSVRVAPGQHALLTDRSVQSFEQINPMSCVAYRNVDARDLGHGVKSFHAEFDILSMMRGLEPLKQMLRSADEHTSKIAHRALKTAALIM